MDKNCANYSVVNQTARDSTRALFYIEILFLRFDLLEIINQLAVHDPGEARLFTRF